MENQPLRALILLFICFSFSRCQKDTADPCEGLLNESPPAMVGILVVDEETGENIIAANHLDSTQVTVTMERDGKPFRSYQIVNDAGANPMRGAVIFYPPQQEDVYLYEIRVGDYGTVKFSYTVSKVETGEACRPHSYPVSDVKTPGRPFEQFGHALLPDRVTLLKVAL